MQSGREHERIHGASNLSAIRDGLRIVRTMFQYSRFSRLPELLPSGMRPMNVPVAQENGQ